MAAQELCFLTNVDAQTWTGILQAGVAAAAIFFGFKGIRAQNDLQRARDENKKQASDAHKMRIVYSAVNQLEVATREWLDNMGQLNEMFSPEAYTARMQTFIEATHLLAGLPVFEIPDAETGTDVIALMHICREVAAAKVMGRSVVGPLQTVLNSATAARHKIGALVPPAVVS